MNCSNLSEITIGEGTKVENSAFDGAGLTKITVKNGANLSANSIRQCTKLKNIIIEDNVTIDSGVFSNCGNIESVVMGKNIKIKGTLFENSKVKTATVESLSEVGGGALRYLGSALQGNIIINEGVTIISSDSFNGCNNMASVSIPSTVTEIGSGAFGGCTSLETVNFPNGLKTLGWRSIL